MLFLPSIHGVISKNSHRFRDHPSMTEIRDLGLSFTSSDIKYGTSTYEQDGKEKKMMGGGAIILQARLAAHPRLHTSRFFLSIIILWAADFACAPRKEKFLLSSQP